MINKGTLVRFKGDDKRFYTGQLLMVHEREGDKLTVWNERKSSNKWTTATINAKDVEEVC